jgi:hypothetical protein
MRVCPSARSLARSVLASATLLLGLGPSSAHAAEKALWGPATLPDGSSAFTLYDELGIDTLQLSLSWADIAATQPADPTNPSDPAYRWPGDVTAAAGEAPSHGIRVSLLVTNTPSWANGDRAAVHLPTSPQDYADFLTAAARRYPAVRRWMIWGEPNRDDRLQPNAENSPIGPRAYALLLDAAYGALKAQSANNKVIGANTWTSGTVKPPDFLRYMRMPSGRPPRLDWFGHNPFPFRTPKLAEGPLSGGFRDISDTDTLSDEVRRAYGRRVPLWLSEYTIQSDRGSAVFATFVPRALQAQYLTAGYGIGDELGARVAGVGWLALLDEPPGADSANWGLLTYGLRRKPAFSAMVRAPSERLRPAVRLGGSTISRRTLRRSGLWLSLTPKAAGPVTVELYSGRRVRARVRANGSAERGRTLRLRASLSPGLYTIKVRAARGAAVHRPLRVR